MDEYQEHATSLYWCRLERPSTGSWLETHVELPENVCEEHTMDLLDSAIEFLYPGWELLTYCPPHMQGKDGRPDDFGEQNDK